MAIYNVIADNITTPPALGDDVFGKWLVPTGASGDWASHVGKIAIAIGTNYTYITLVDGDVVINTANGKIYAYSSSALNVVYPDRKNMGRLSFNNIDTTAASPANGDVEFEDGMLWCYDSSRSKWLAVGPPIETSFAVSGVVSGTQVLSFANGGSSANARWLPHINGTIVSARARMASGTITTGTCYLSLDNTTTVTDTNTIITVSNTVVSTNGINYDFNTGSTFAAYCAVVGGLSPSNVMFSVAWKPRRPS